MPRVVVTGLGFITSIGNSKAAVLESLQTLKHGIALYPPFQKENIPVKLAASVKEYNTESPDPEDWTYPERYKLRQETLRGLSPHGLYAYCAMVQGIQDAGLSEKEVSMPRTGLFTASAGSMANTYRYMSRLYQYGVQRCSPMGIISSIAGTLNFNLVATFQIKGASCGFCSACSSSGHALSYAYEEIRQGRQDRMIVVGAEDGNLESILPFAAMRVLSLSLDPNRASRPFDRDRDGFVGTGGAVVMILEEETVARKRGASIYAEFLGWGQASDGFHIAISHPQGDGLVLAIGNAFKTAGISPESVDYVNAHAPSTAMGDISEVRALQRIFGNNGRKPAISSTKALTGHGLSSSSIMEAAFCTLAIKEEFIPGSAHIETLEPEAAGLNIIRQTRDMSPRVVLSNSSGFGGANVALLLGAYGTR